jgi:guanylate kinase
MMKTSQPTSTHAPSPLLVLISAPSGGGKTTLCDQLLAARPGLVRAVTCTTRAPRGTEKDGVDYHFLGASVFQAKVAAGEFLEHATVYGNSYGTLKSEVLGKLREGKDVLLNVDVQGAAAIREATRHIEELRKALVTLFLTPPAIEVLEARLRKRGTDAPEVIAKRLSAARNEIAHWSHFDYLIPSASIAEDLRLATVILEAEKMRSTRACPPEF